MKVSRAAPCLRVFDFAGVAHTILPRDVKAPPKPFSKLTALQKARRVVIAIVGTTVLALGVALLVLPGPAFVVIPTGLAILAIEFVWAKRWLRKVKRFVKRNAARMQSTGRAGSSPATTPVQSPTRATADPTPEPTTVSDSVPPVRCESVPPRDQSSP